MLSAPAFTRRKVLVVRLNALVLGLLRTCSLITHSWVEPAELLGIVCSRRQMFQGFSLCRIKGWENHQFTAMLRSGIMTWYTPVNRLLRTYLVPRMLYHLLDLQPVSCIT